MAEIYFSKDHEWVRVEEGVGVVVGISEYAAHELGDVTFVEPPRVGNSINQFELLGCIESVKAASDIFSPVSGTVIKVNEALETEPELINQSPQDDGWIAWIKPDDLNELKKLMTQAQYQDYLKGL